MASKKSSAKGSDARVGVNREHAVADAGVANAVQILGGAEPEIGRPYLDAEFAPQKDG